MSLSSIALKTLQGKPYTADLKNKVVLIVNVASKCGFTPQYKGLEALHQKFKNQGVVVLGFPCNQFGAQEPGSPEEIQTFCSRTYDVTFDILEKGDVNGPNTHPLYQFLKNGKDIRWNFEKFIVGKDGQVVAHFDSRKTPAELEAEIQKYL
ncbi:glutathione peroxidase [Gorgonomyces haynaldii]|nr:glutathione peroxidase [Gorgonomyces haynaldii]